MQISISKPIFNDKLKAKAYIDAQVGWVRRFFITDISGQEMIYQEKEKQALLVLEALPGTPDLADIPDVAGEAEDDNVTIEQKATQIVTLATQWRQISPLIERRRLQHKKLVDAATTPAEIEAAKAMDWSDILALVPS